MEDKIKDGEYAAALITFVDRETGISSKSMCYPITMFTLFDVDDVLKQGRGRVFKVVDGKWMEQQ